MSGSDSLDSLLYECTKSVNDALDIDAVMKFCSAIDNDLDGPSTAARLLGHKIQSPQQQESLNALCVADECIKRCGRRFQDEVGKFRFLNEIIKMVSPKYFGDKTSSKVKTKCIELLYRWSIDLRHEPKILDAYEMLKKQGIIDDDPILGEGETNGEVGTEAFPTGTEAGAVAAIPAATHNEEDKANHSIFDDEDKSKLLARLLRSKHPDDLQAANRLIKNMVKQDEEKQEKISQRFNLLETVRNNVKLLNEMLDCFQMAGGSSSSDRDIIKELYKNIEQERPKLFKLASDTEDKDSNGMSQVLQVNDEVVQISQRYKQVIEQGEEKPGDKQQKTTPPSDDLAGLDLAGSNTTDLFSGFEGAPPVSAPAKSDAASSILDLFSTPTTSTALPTMMTHTPFSVLGSAPPTFQAPPTFPAQPQPSFQAQAPPNLSAFPLVPSSTSGSNTAPSNLDSIFSFNNATTSATPTPTNNAGAMISSTSLSEDIGLLSLDSTPAESAGLAAPLMPANNEVSLFDMSEPEESLFNNTGSKKAALEDLDFLGQDLLQKTKPAQQVVMPVAALPAPVKRSLNQLKATNVEKSLNVATPAPQAVVTPAPVPVQPLTNIHVPLTTVKPGEFPPLTVHEKDDVKLVIHFAQNKPRDDVNVMVITITSTRAAAIKSIMFQAAVPKLMKVKLQHPSATELPGFNPILPASAITQVMLLANPNKEKVKLKYKLTYLLDGSSVSNTGDVVNFPL